MPSVKGSVFACLSYGHLTGWLALILLACYQYAYDAEKALIYVVDYKRTIQYGTD